jgi:hypothetical protein
MRYDRILARKNSTNLTPISIQMIGREEIHVEQNSVMKIKEMNIHPSDHFGLLATFDVS